MKKRPNVILVVFDTARRDRFSCYGHDRPTTPTVDALAADGMQVENMIANAPWTMPSHASMFTGLYPSQHGAQWQTGPRMRDSVPLTMAEWFRNLGYQTVCATNNGLISSKTKLARGFDRYVFRLDLEQGQKRIRRRLRKVLFGGDSGGLILNEWMRSEIPQVSKPMFLFVNYLECHWAYVPPRRLEKKMGGPRFGFIEGARYRAGVARNAGPWEAIARADERTLEIYSNLYDAELANVDEHLAELVGILKTSGHFKEGETVLIVTSDHGEHLGEHGLADHHASLDDLLVHVPFVVYAPGIVPSSRPQGLYELVDVLPSLAALIGEEVPEHLAERRSDLFTQDGHGKTAAGFAEWRAWSDKERARLAGRNPSFEFDGLGSDLLSATDGRFTLLRSSGGSDALFDRRTDPLQEKDVAARHPEVASSLGTRLDAEIRRWQNGVTDDDPLTADDERAIEERLSALGYL